MGYRPTGAKHTVPRLLASLLRYEKRHHYVRTISTLAEATSPLASGDFTGLGQLMR